MIEDYKKSLSCARNETFEQAQAAVDGNLFVELGELRSHYLKKFFATNPGFGFYVALLRQLNMSTSIVARDKACLEADWKVPRTNRALVAVPTSHPTHSRTASMRNAYRQVYEHLAGHTPLQGIEVLERLLPPVEPEQWNKPSLVHDEMPMMAEAIANQAVALHEELGALPTVADRDALLACTARPEVWGAYDQDGHPDALPGYMFLQRAHLRYAMWSAYVTLAKREGLDDEDIERIESTANYWGSVVGWLSEPGRLNAQTDNFEFIEMPGYPDAAGKLGAGESESSEQEALLKLIGQDHPRLKDVVERFGTSGAKGHFRFTAGGDRGLWRTSEDNTEIVDVKAMGALALRFKEIKALGGDVGTVIIAECDNPAHFGKTIALMRQQGVMTWLDDPEGGVVVMPLIEEGDMTAGISKALIEMLDQRRAEGKPLPQVVHLMVAGSDLVNREGKVGQMLETARALEALLDIATAFPGTQVRLMEGVGGSSVRTGGASRIVELRDALRLKDGPFDRSAITFQGIVVDADYGTRTSARATSRLQAERLMRATATVKNLDQVIQFLKRLNQHVGLHQSSGTGERQAMRKDEGFEKLFAPGNKVVDGIMSNRRDGSRTAKQGTPSKGVGPEGERTISYVKMMRATGGLQWHHDWRKVPDDLKKEIAEAWKNPEHAVHAVVQVLVADMAVELTRVDLDLADEALFPDQPAERQLPDGSVVPNRDPAMASAFSAMCKAHDNLCEFLEFLGVYRRRSGDVLMPEDDRVRAALLEELGLPVDTDDNGLEMALLARRGEVRLQVHMQQSGISAEAAALQLAAQWRNSYDGPGAADLSVELMERWGLQRHPSTLATPGVSRMLPNGDALLTRDGELQLGTEGLAAHEQFHADSGRAKAAFAKWYGDGFYDAAISETLAARNAASDVALALRTHLILEGMPSRTDSTMTRRLRNDHAQATLALATRQKPLTEAKLQALAKAASLQLPNADQALAFAAETARQNEKAAQARASETVIRTLLDSPEALDKSREAVAAAHLPNEARHLLFNLTGGLLGVPSHMETLKTSEDTRAFAHALTAQDFATLRGCLPDTCANDMLAMERESREAAERRQALLEKSRSAAVAAPLFRRAQKGDARARASAFELEQDWLMV
ncbi:hypothetical protein [Variovorax sp. KK3]|uniref:hypothetical protein n=1 Tax=Variovorax sp. KK3 TaxID=1855728 RepID=UPI001180168F|nr:hypothetical protein [Variovorax sp. KK3]